MTDDDSTPFPPAMFAQQMQDAGEQAMKSQQELFEQFLGNAGSSAFGPMNMGTATFKTRVQSGGRISIPDAEREALNIEEGDIVQAVIVPVKRNRDNDD
ncbi:hypothetical protein BRD00_01185 [Halobacteriales archaeon QS_8_69_26]|nr:MAG: hypothetical protein BRD00_01185 [Halobacteriales archaeon QS_8_69_26]